MRLTCLKCGYQIELAGFAAGARVTCSCGEDYTCPEVHDTGVRPSARAAEQSRSRAFRAAGLVRNFGGFALALACFGILFFPLAIAGVVLGAYVLVVLRGPVGRYSGRRSAIIAVALGSVVAVTGITLTCSWVEQRREQRLADLRQTASEDLRALLRAERLFRAGHDTFGTFKEFRFTPPHGQYTIYLSDDDVISAVRDDRTITDPLPSGANPAVSEDAFTAVAVASIYGDERLDVWVIDDSGHLRELADGASDPAEPSESSPEE